MKINLRQILLESHSIEIIDYTNNLLINLNDCLKRYNIPKTEIIIFGSFILGTLGIRKPNDLDIGITKKYFNILKEKVKTGTDAQIDINNLSFIHEDAVPKINNISIFDIKGDKYKGFNIITFSQWKQMKEKDPSNKDKKLLKQ